MHLIEPCCAPKHLLALRGKLGDKGTALWHGYGDLSLAELLPPMLTRYIEIEMMFVSPTLPDAAATVLERMMRKKRMKADGKGSFDVIRHLTLVSNLCEKKSPAASRWLEDNPFGERMTIRNVQQNDTAILLPDIAFVGNINLTYGSHFIAIATKDSRVIENFRNNYLSI